MAVFILLVHDVHEEYDELPLTLCSLRDWWEWRQCGETLFELDLYGGVGLRLGHRDQELIADDFGRLEQTAMGCRAAAQRLAAGKVALLRTSTDNPGAYLLFSAEDPVRVTWIRERLPADPYPFFPSENLGHGPEAAEWLLAWAENHAARLLAPSENPAFDKARGLQLRLPRAELVADLNAEAELAEQILAAR